VKRSALAVAALVCALSLSGCTDEFKDNCTARQGFIKSDQITTVTPTADGTVAVGVSTIRYCVINGTINPKDIEIS
jgi:hypothetical protein